MTSLAGYDDVCSAGLLFMVCRFDFTRVLFKQPLDHGKEQHDARNKLADNDQGDEPQKQNNRQTVAGRFRACVFNCVTGKGR